MTTEIPEQVYRDAWGAAVDVQTDEPIDLPREERDRNADMFMGFGFRAAVESAYRAGLAARWPIDLGNLLGWTPEQIARAERNSVTADLDEDES